MQITEVLLTGLLFAMLVALFAPRLLNLSTFVVLGAVVAIGGFLFEGFRWQMIPAYLVLVALGIVALKRSKSRLWPRVAGSIVAALLLTTAVFLSSQLPVADLPAPAGPYLVGTFSSSVIDPERTERFAATRPRELGIQVWYPAQGSPLPESRQSLFHDFHTGPADTISFFTSYLRRVQTHSYRQAAIATDGPFPVIFFNHGLFTSVDQNVLLMEHLVSHGYVVIAIGHPYESLKVNLPNSGQVMFHPEYPADVGFTQQEVSDGGIGEALGRITGTSASELTASLYRVLDKFVLADADQRKSIVSNAVRSEELQALVPVLSEPALHNFFLIRSKVRNRSVQTWVEDMQFLAGHIDRILSPVPQFYESLQLSGFGVIGMSYGGAAAGEFCKVDSRCVAGSNLDGTQFGVNWQTPVQVPFLMMYSDASPQGNDYAYYPVASDFYEVHVRRSEHADFLDASYAFPIFKTLGVAGEIKREQMVAIVNELHLAFFNQYLKGGPHSMDQVALRFMDHLTMKVSAPKNDS